MGARQFDSHAADERDEVDLNGVAAALGRNKRLVAKATVAAAAAGLLFCLVSSPRYMAEARLLVENQESYFTSASPEGARDGEMTQSLDPEAINSQIQLLTSRDLARRAVQKLGLKGNPEFDPESSFLAGLMRPLALFGLGGARTDAPPDDRLINKFIDHLTVMSPSKTRVLQVEFSSRDPDLAARAANAVVDLYIDMKSQAKREDAHLAAQSLKPLIASLEARVSEADAKVEAFRARTGLYESSENRSVPTQQLGEIATRLSEARAMQSDLEAKARGLRDLLKQGRARRRRRHFQQRTGAPHLRESRRGALAACRRIAHPSAGPSAHQGARGAIVGHRDAASRARWSRPREGSRATPASPRPRSPTSPPCSSSRRARSAPRTPMRRNCRNCSATPKS